MNRRTKSNIKKEIIRRFVDSTVELPLRFKMDKTTTAREDIYRTYDANNRGFLNLHWAQKNGDIDFIGFSIPIIDNKNFVFDLLEHIFTTEKIKDQTKYYVVYRTVFEYGKQKFYEQKER